MPEHRKLQLAQQPLVDIIHLCITGEEYKGAPPGNFEEFANALGRFRCKLRRACIGQIGRHIKQSLIFVIEMRWQHRLAGMLKPQPLPDVLKSAAHSERGRSQHRALEL